MQDLELMHHYTAHAYLTLPGLQFARQVWGYSVPQEAFKYPFLMHSILAFSANHLAYMNPAKTSHFRLLAGTHQTAALTELNSNLANVQTGNCHAIFASASITVLNAFADPRSYDLDVLIETFQLLRGLQYVISKIIPDIEKGPFAPIVRATKIDAETPPPLLSSFLVELQASNLAVPNPNDTTPVQAARIKAAESLRHVLQFSLETSPHASLRASMMWPFTLEVEFVEMLKTRTDPGVRDLFKRYCQLLAIAGSDFWFLSGWREVSKQL